MRGNLEFCDGSIVSSDNKEYTIHRIVLCGGSKKLASLYVEADIENQRTISVDINSSILEGILECFYLGEFPSNPPEIITWSNLNDVFQAATFLELPELKVICMKFVYTQLIQNSCYILDFYRLVDSDKSNEDMKRILLNIVVANFPRVTNKWEFKGEDLIEILNDELLNTKNEEEVIQVIEEWIRFNYENKDDYLLQLCKCVRIDQLQCPEMSFKYISERNSCNQRISGTLNCPRVPYYLIFVHGGWHHSHPLCDMEVFDPRTNSWIIQAQQTPSRRCYHSMIVFDKILYVIGGFDGRRYYSTVSCYDPVTHLWSLKSCMQYKRCYVASCVSGEYVYTMGGFDGTERLRCAERYHPRSNQWQLLPEMLDVRSDASCCAVGDDIIVAGGFDGIGGLRTVECFNSKTWQWTVLENLNESRSGLSLIFTSNQLYAIGGFDGFQRLASLEKYSFNRKRWIKKNPNHDMHSCRSNFGCVAIDDTIYVFGGYNGISTIAHCECYDLDSKKWTELPDLKIKRSAVAACSIYKLDKPTFKEQMERFSNIKATEND